MGVTTITTTNEKLIEILQKQMDIEESTLSELVEAEESVTEPAVRLILMELRLDTWRHKKLLEGIIEILDTTPCDTWSAKVQRYIDRVKLGRTLESVLVGEGQMIEYLEQAILEVDDPLAIAIFERLKDDEERHDKDLREVITMIKTAPLQTKKGEKGSDIVCPPD